MVRCRTVFTLLSELASRFGPDAAAEITGLRSGEIVEAARLIAANRPVSHYFYNGLVQHTNGVQASRAITIFYALLGDWDRAGGNVIPPTPTIAGWSTATSSPTTSSSSATAIARGSSTSGSRSSARTAPAG